jgi:hypothetical protein
MHALNRTGLLAEKMRGRVLHHCDDGDRAAKIIQDALGIESDHVVNYTFPKTWPEDREQRARIIGRSNKA